MRAVWHHYFTALKNVYELLRGQDCLIKYHNVFHAIDGGLGQGWVNKFHRGVYQIKDERALQHLEELLATAEQCYYLAIADTDKITLEDAKKKGLPINFPRQVERDVVQMVIYNNKAHASVRYADTDKEAWVNVAAYQATSLTLTELSRDELAEHMDNKAKEMAQLIRANGLTPKVAIIDTLAAISVPAHELFARYGYPAIQHRYPTGRQYRAGFYKQGDDGLQKSEPKPLGVRYIVPNQQITVTPALQRKRRTDRLDMADVPHEIILDFIPKEQRVGRLYGVMEIG